MQKIINRNLSFAILINAVLFFLFLLLFNPRFNTDTDIYFLYTLSGGFGNEPSALLHYSDIAHPLLNGVVCFFFKYFPVVNWYSFFLLLFHFIACVILFRSFLNYFPRYHAIAFFLIFFLFAECRLLLWLDFSGVSLIGVISGSVSLLLCLKKEVESNNKKILLFGLLILTAGLIRLHYVALFGVFAIWMGLFFLSRAQLLKLIKILFLTGLFVVLLFQAQRYYYKKKIPGWSVEERFRKAQFYFSNHPRKQTLSFQTGVEKLKQDLISTSLFYDTSFTDYKSLKDFGKNNVEHLSLSKISSVSLYWLFMDIKLYFLLFAVIAVFVAINNVRWSLSRFIYMSSFFILVFVILALFFKVTEVILVAILSSIILSGFLCFEIKPHKKHMIILYFLLLVSCAWMVIRLVSISRQNRVRISFARNVINEFNSHKNILFVDAGTFLNLNLSIWDDPGKYPIHNFIYKELFFSNSYKSQLNRYGISDLMKEIPVKNNIYLAGAKALILIEYYKLLYNKTVRAEKVPGFHYIDAYQIKLDTSNSKYENAF